MDEKDKRKLKRHGALIADKHSKKTGLPVIARVVEDDTAKAGGRCEYEITTPSGAKVVLATATVEGRNLRDYPKRDVRTQQQMEKQHAQDEVGSEPGKE